MNTKKVLTMKLLAIFLTTLPLFAFAAGEGGSAGGGGNISTISKTALSQLILDEKYNLKASLINYLRTIDIKQIEDSSVKSFFTEKVNIRELIADITQSDYSVFEGCQEIQVDKIVAAKTNFQQLGGTICFDLEQLFIQVSKLSAEDALIQVAALALHEHIHHFQLRDNKLLDKNESQAYRIAAYFLLTAKTTQVPLLEWSGKIGNKKLKVGDRIIVENNYNLTKGYVRELFKNGFARIEFDQYYGKRIVPISDLLKQTLCSESFCVGDYIVATSFENTPCKIFEAYEGGIFEVIFDGNAYGTRIVHARDFYLP